MSASNSSQPGQYLTVTPANAGVQGDRLTLAILDPSPDLIRGFRRDDEGKRTGLKSAIALALLLLAVLPAPLSRARAEEQPSAAAMAKAREVVAASMVPGSEDQMIGGISASIDQLILSVNPGREAQIGPVVDAYFTPLLRQHFSELSDVPAAEFARSFTPAELDQILAFYRSPLGKKYLEAQAKVQTDMMTQGPTVTRKLLDEAMKKMGPELGRQGLKVPSY
ncbi:MAG TPA: DUF2059 domain-containing protein [Dongiaceae bacterium]|nr:DUF2059 domain-containing protein [Dongiaceae bacterium]